MIDSDVKRLRELAAQINVSITNARAVMANTTDAHTRAIVAGALGDLEKAQKILNARLR